jgi:hypothetical protein
MSWTTERLGLRGGGGDEQPIVKAVSHHWCGGTALSQNDLDRSNGIVVLPDQPPDQRNPTRPFNIVFTTTSR